MTATLAPDRPRLVDESFFQPDEAGLGVSLSDLANTIQVWSLLHTQAKGEEATVALAADVFHIAPDLVARAVENHPWMFLTGPEDDLTRRVIEHEGE